MVKRIKEIENNPEYRTLEKPNNKIENYEGRDIKIFEDKSNWHGWQLDIYNMLFKEDKTIKTPDDRKIISIIDIKRNSGKSSFFKWLVYNNMDKIERLTYWTAS